MPPRPCRTRGRRRGAPRAPSPPAACPHRHAPRAKPQGTLGGDAGELAGAIYTYLKVQGVTGDITSAVRDIFNDFMAQVASPERPFYYHTSDEKLHKVFKSVNEDGELDPKVTVFPEM